MILNYRQNFATFLIKTCDQLLLDANFLDLPPAKFQVRFSKMGKRASRGNDDSSRKRQKIVHEAPTSEEIHASRQLQQLLIFDQDLQKARHGMPFAIAIPPTKRLSSTNYIKGLQSFKIFLDGILSEDGAGDQHIQIIKDYLENAKRQDGDSETTFLPDLMETWSYAAHANNENILSAVPVCLALLLKFISQRLDLTANGLGIGRTLLQKRQQELVARNLSADKSKEFIISPTLRMMREVMCLDGGTLAKPLFRARNFTFKSLARNMGIRYLGDGLEDVKRPSSRTNAIRFFLSALKFLHVEAMVELLSQKELPLALTKSLKDDPPYLLVEIVDTLRNHVLKDEKLPGQIKAKLLNSMTLSRFASLYHYPHDKTRESGKVSVEDSVHALLRTACTSSTAGILRQQSGYYPRHVEPDAIPLPSAEDEIEPGLETITWTNKFRDDIPVRNAILADFVKSLRPHSSLKQSELLLAIFEVAPELVARYFIDKQAFTFDPKLSATWIGYSAFLYNTIQQPIPKYFGHKEGYARAPPPTSIIVDNILPLPMNQKVLIKCLGQKSDLIPFITVRLLVMAMQKLQTALRFHREAARSQMKSIWDESSRKLIDEFCQRAPGIKEVISCYRAMEDEDLLQREATSRLLRSYYEVIPQVALMAKFDVSPLLITAIKKLDESDESPQDRALRLVELENLLAIAEYSPGMRWFTKAQGLSVSPFIALLKVLVDAPSGVFLNGIKNTLTAVAKEHQLVQSEGAKPIPVVDALLLTKQSTRMSSYEALWTLLDSSTSRCATAPIKYLEKNEDFNNSDNDQTQGSPTRTSPLTLAIIEQLPFAINPASEEDLSILAHFASNYLASQRTDDQEDVAFDQVSAMIDSAFSEKPTGLKLLRKLVKKSSVSRKLQSWGADFAAGKEQQNGDARSEQLEQTMSQEELAELLVSTSPLPTNNSALSKWANKEPDELVEEGYAATVVSLLASEHTSIRKEALIGLSKMAAKINESSYEEKEQIWLLLSEVVESCKPQVDMGPIPNTIVAFVRHALTVLKDPLHCLYGKINTFLLKSPLWRLDRLPLVHDILREGPELDDTYYSELSWLFSCLLDGLQAEPDMAMYHNTRLFERLLSLTSNSYMRQNLRAQVLRIIYRATCIQGGSTTLVTRFGIISWLETQAAVQQTGTGADVYKALARRIWETADQERVQEWSKHGIEAALARMS